MIVSPILNYKINTKEELHYQTQISGVGVKIELFFFILSRKDLKKRTVLKDYYT